jgi:hypothetical protein
MFYFPLSSLLTPSQPPPYYIRISIFIWHNRREVHEIKKFNHIISWENTPTWDDVSNYSNISFLSVRLLIWKPVAYLKSVTFLGNCNCVAVASFFGVPSSSQSRTFPPFINYRVRDISQDLAGGTLTRIVHRLGQANDSNIIRDRTRIVVSVINAVPRRHTQRAGLSDIQPVGSQDHIVSVSPGKCQY